MPDEGSIRYLCNAGAGFFGPLKNDVKIRPQSLFRNVPQTSYSAYLALETRVAVFVTFWRDASIDGCANRRFASSNRNAVSVNGS